MKIVYIVFFISSIISCASIRDNNTNSGTFSVRVINETNFDVSVLEEDNFIPRKTEKTIELPIQGNTSSEGYPLTFYVNITDDDKKTIPHRNIIIKEYSQTVRITDEHINFNSNDCFFVIDNKSNFSIMVRKGQDHIPEWNPDAEDKEKRTQILPGETSVYEADNSFYFIENQDSERNPIPISLKYKEGHVYYFVFDGSSVVLDEFFPLHEVYLHRAEDYDSKVKKAINELTLQLPSSPFEISIGNIFIEGTQIPSELSHSLYTKIEHYAARIDTSRLIVFSRENAMNNESFVIEKGLIQGSFAQRGDNVEIKLQLVSNLNYRIIGSSLFTISTTELNRLGINIEPENSKIAQEREQIFSEFAIQQKQEYVRPIHTTPASAQFFRIFAWSNSRDNTFRDGEKMKITLMTDRDCYFKVYYISVNNDPPAMIFPFIDETNNRLQANLPRQIPGGSGYPLHAPYGVETIFIVASTVPFENIEAEYSAPGADLNISANSQLRNLISKTRGLSMPGKPDNGTAITTETFFHYLIRP